MSLKLIALGKWEALLKIELGAEYDFPRTETYPYFETHSTTWFASPATLLYVSAAVHSLILLKVNSDGDNEIIAEHKSFMPFFFYVPIGATTVHSRDDLPPEPNRTTCPYRDWFVTSTKTDLSTGETEITYAAYDIYDSRLMQDAPDYDNPTTDIADNFYFPVQDSYNVKFANQGDFDRWSFDAFYDSNRQQGDLFARCWRRGYLLRFR